MVGCKFSSHDQVDPDMYKCLEDIPKSRLLERASDFTKVYEKFASKSRDSTPRILENMLEFMFSFKMSDKIRPLIDTPRKYYVFLFSILW